MSLGIGIILVALHGLDIGLTVAVTLGAITCPRSSKNMISILPLLFGRYNLEFLFNE